MADSLPDFAQLLLFVSQKASQHIEISHIAVRVLQEMKRWGALRASLQICLPHDQNASLSSLDEPGQRHARFVFSKAIAVKGVHYGLLAVEMDVPKGSPANWMLMLDALSQQFGLLAERAWLQFENEQRASELALAGDELHTLKALARAAGLLVRDRKVDLEQAKQWITKEAVRREQPVRTIAEQIVLQHRLQVRWNGQQRQVPAHSASPLRREVAA
jgi:hypothetical protein